jgi:hypothetical protein
MPCRLRSHPASKPDGRADLPCLALFYDSESEVGYAGGRDHSDAFQLDWRYTQMVERPHSAPEQDGRYVYVDFIHQAGGKALLQDTGGAYHNIIFPGPLHHPGSRTK